MEKDCLFCKIIAGGIPAAKVYEDENFLAFLDIRPINPGHVLLLPKRHCENLYGAPDEVLSAMGPIMRKLAIAVKKATGADGINVGMNNEPAAGQEIFHAHLHVMPRFLDDGYEMWRGRPYEEESVRNEMAKRIRERLEE